MSGGGHPGTDGGGRSRGPRWGMALVRGRSMLPVLREGDRLLVRYDAAVRPGDLVVARLADGTVAVKRAAERRRTASGRDGWWVLSENPAEGVDSRHRGPVPEEDVAAVVVARLWPRPWLFRPGGRRVGHDPHHSPAGRPPRR